MKTFETFQCARLKSVFPGSIFSSSKCEIVPKQKFQSWDEGQTQETKKSSSRKSNPIRQTLETLDWVRLPPLAQKYKV